jgi:hypothetical protein
MGAVMSRTRVIPTAAPRAAAALKPTPPPAATTTGYWADRATKEMQQNRRVTDMLNTTSILTQNQMTGGTLTAKAAAPESLREDEDEGVPSDELVKLLVLHAKQPDRWDVQSLSQKFGITNKTALASALKYVQPFRIEDDKQSGRTVATPFEPETQDAHTQG